MARPLLPLTEHVSLTETNVRSLIVTSVFPVKSAGGTIGLSALYGRTLSQWSFFTKLIHINYNSISFVNVPTPPSVHHHVYVC